MTGLQTPLITATAGFENELIERQQAYLEIFTAGLDTAPANLMTDRFDGTVRWIFPGWTSREEGAAGLPAAIARKLGTDPPASPLPLRYRAPPDGEQPAFRAFPAHVVSVLPRRWFEDKVVLIGADLPMTDRHRTPYAATQGRDGYWPGVRIHAHALAQLLGGGEGVRTPGTWGSVGIVLAMALLGAGAGRVNLGVVGKGVLLLMIAGAYGLLAQQLWARESIMIGLLAPVMGLGFSFTGAVVYFGRREREMKQFIREAFSRYLSPKLVEQLIEHPDRLKVGGERRELTYIFTDIAGFTTLTEQSDPERLVSMLNGYIDAMCNIAMEHGATLDKIIGDATVSFFNAPLDQEDHPARAVRCAMAMDQFAREFRTLYAAQGMALGITRIGVHTGTATIGNFGGEAFFDYTAFGDMVNTAARLESVNKHLGTHICVSAATANRCPGIAFRPIGVLVLKGKHKGLEVFEPLDEERRDAPLTKVYNEAYALMRENGDGARLAFERARELDPTDPLVNLHLNRLKAGETGVEIVMKEK